VNGPQGFLPSYDIGGAVVWGYGSFGIKGVIMNIGENDEGKNYNYYGAQFNYSKKSVLGEGNYRIIINGTSKDFSNPDGTEEEMLSALLLSFD